MPIAEKLLCCMGTQSSGCGLNPNPTSDINGLTPRNGRCDAYMSGFCISNPNSPECQCLNENNIPDTISEIVEASAARFCFNPNCALSGNYITDEIFRFTCDVTVCEQQIIANGDNILQAENQQTLICGSNTYTREELTNIINTANGGGGGGGNGGTGEDAFPLTALIFYTIVAVLIIVFFSIIFLYFSTKNKYVELQDNLDSYASFILQQIPQKSF
jgi:hypothetical protein